MQVGLAGVATGLLSVLVVGCSAAPVANEGQWVPDVLALGQATDVDLVRTIAEDGQITEVAARAVRP
ncbi:hypothetical protein ASE15_15805 [Oerskovia sp. Root22]|nr:hypothetical protein ASE15_15805 [Oerskovia sp. Root22]